MKPHARPVFSYISIGIIHSPYTEPAGMPIQPAGAVGMRGTVAIDEQFQDGLRDLSGFSRIILIYAFHR
jgi:tRNA (Thr-GGU) A37 N-methylase